VKRKLSEIAGVGALAFLACLPSHAQTGPSSLPADAPLPGAEIARTLSGNSIVHPNFGCVFYRPDGTTLQVGQGGLRAEGKWEVEGDLYFSSGSCGTAGCSLAGRFPSFVFLRTDGGYRQEAIVILGNHCEKDGVVS
jgi:hypothetical protein